MKIEKIVEEGINQAYFTEENSLAKALSNDSKSMKDLVTGFADSRVFESGAKRDTNKGKIRPDLISPYMLKALGKVLATGAEHYGDRNWEKGMPQECFKESAARHYVQWMNNETNEDHAAQLIFNVMAWIHFRDKDGK